jgi:hypothetical protein
MLQGITIVEEMAVFDAKLVEYVRFSVVFAGVKPG